MSDNPFERWDLDPMDGPQAITEKLRELAEAADDETTRAAIREAWEQLTMHPRGRLEAALGAHPETRKAAGRPPRPRRRARPPRFDPQELTLEDVEALPGVARALGPIVNPEDIPDAPLDADPIVGKRHPGDA